VPRPAPRRRSLSAALVAGLVAVVVAAVTSVGVVAAGPVPPAGAQQRHAVVVSDSILLGAQGPLTSRLQGAGWTVDFDGAVSRSTSAGADAVRAKGLAVSDTLVLSLGANDSGNAATFRSRVDAVMGAAAHVPHVYWITIREVRPYYAPANQVLRDAAARHPNLTIVDWHAASAGRTGLTASDGLHLSPSGASELASLVAGAVMTGTPVVAAPQVAPVAGVPAPSPTPAPAPPGSTPPSDTAIPEPAVAVAVPAETPAPAPEPAVAPVGDATAAIIGFDRAAFVEPAPVAAAAEPVVPAGGALGAGWIVACLLVVAAGGFALARRAPWMPYALRSSSVTVRSAAVTRSELRAARIAGSQDRHPSAAVVAPVPGDMERPEQPLAADSIAAVGPSTPDVDGPRSELSGSGSSSR